MEPLANSHIRFYNFAVVIFLYATLIVDVYRKMVGINTDVIRNLIYVFSLALVLWDAVKTNRIVHMLLIFMVMSLLFLISSMLYPNHGQAYFSAWMLFVCRLWPAYYIGRYTDNWNEVSRKTRQLIWIALVYALVASTSNLFERSGGNSSYATIAANLFYVTWIAFFDSFHSRRIGFIIICIICFVPVLFLGTRAGMFGLLLSLALWIIRSIGRSDAQKKISKYALLVISFIVIAVLFSAISDFLFDLLPNSRTLAFIRNGVLFNDSNRSDSYYSRMILELGNHPLKMYGLVGNQIFIAGENAPIDTVLSSFAHNVYLELCMNFGVIAGFLLSLYFTVLIVKAFLKSKNSDQGVEFIYLGCFGMTLVNMLVSLSWQFSYEIWLLIGMAYGILRTSRRQSFT